MRFDGKKIGEILHENSKNALCDLMGGVLKSARICAATGERGREEADAQTRKAEEALKLLREEKARADQQQRGGVEEGVRPPGLLFFYYTHSQEPRT